MAYILCLSGWATSGKNAIGSYLETNYGAKQYAFADALKRYVADEYNIPYHLTQTQEGKMTFIQNVGKTLRDLLIERGQEIRKEKQNPGFFAQIVADSMKAETTENPDQRLFVITDLRLYVEYDTLLKEFQDYPYVHIKTIRVKRNGLRKSPVDHWTETQLDDCNMDFTIENPGTTLEELYTRVDECMDKIYSS